MAETLNNGYSAIKLCFVRLKMELAAKVKISEVKAPSLLPISFGAERATEFCSQLLDFETPESLILSYAIYNPNTKPSLFPAIYTVMAAVCEVGHNIFPAQVRGLVAGKDVMDLGCGTTLYGAAFRALGATSYVGVDPNLDITQRQFRSRVLKKRVNLSISLETILGRVPNIRYYLSINELINEQFDVIVLHNVTEHLLDIRGVFDKIHRLLRPGGQIWFLHTNFYSWSGHLQEPRNPKQFDPQDSAHVAFADWGHILFEPAQGHPIQATMNRIRLSELKAAVEERFEILSWVEKEDSSSVRSRLTPEIERRHANLSRRELLTKNVVCQALKFTRGTEEI